PSSPPPGPSPEGSAPAEPSSRSTRERIAELRSRADELQQQAQTRFEHERARRGWIRTVVEAWEMDRQRGGPLLSGGFAYRIFLFEVPAMLFVICLFGLYTDLGEVAPDDLARDAGLSAAVASVIAQAVTASDSGRLWLLVLSAWLTVWAARSAVRAAMLISTIAWQLPIRSARATMKGALAFLGIMFSGIALQALAPALFGGGPLVDLLVIVLVTLAVAALVVVAMYLLPHGGSGWLAVVPGALLVAVGLRGLSLATKVYFADHLDKVDTLYGGLGVAIVILLYLYLAARFFVWGQFLNARLGGVVGVPLGSRLAVPEGPSVTPQATRRGSADDPPVD
ncbi:MAG: YhjD/YihY/BrkB family envelope integrity protein, partial [Actinomycetota bacterium]